MYAIPRLHARQVVAHTAHGPRPEARLSGTCMFLSSVALQQAVMGRPCMQNRTNGSVAVVGPHATAEAIKIDVTAGPMKTLLATSFARAGAAAGSRFSVLPLFRLLFW